MKEQNLQSYCLPDYGEIPITVGMKVATNEGEGTEFFIQLPLN
jgi:hypothetical protein